MFQQDQFLRDHIQQVQRHPFRRALGGPYTYLPYDPEATAPPGPSGKSDASSKKAASSKHQSKLPSKVFLPRRNVFVDFTGEGDHVAGVEIPQRDHPAFTHPKKEYNTSDHLGEDVALTRAKFQWLVFTAKEGLDRDGEPLKPPFSFLYPNQNRDFEHPEPPTKTTSKSSQPPVAPAQKFPEPPKLHDLTPQDRTKPSSSPPPCRRASI